MKRYNFVDASYASMVMEENGEYVLASEAQGLITALVGTHKEEIERLKAIIAEMEEREADRALDRKFEDRDD